ncbi:hypothetical protein Tco_0160495 [Tanacetum coccineum]
MLLCYEPDTAYGLRLIRCISDELALVVEIDFTWSLGFDSIESDRPPIPLSLILSVSVFDQDTKNFNCCIGRILALLLYIVQVDRVLQTACNKLLPEYSLLPLVGSPLYSVVPCIVRIRPEHRLLAFEDVPLCHFWEYSAISWMAIFASAARGVIGSGCRVIGFIGSV